MRRTRIIEWLTAMAALLALLPPALAAAPTVHPVTARLVAETTSVAPGQTLWVDLHLEIARGWHTYWKNPGDSGIPTEIAWQLPAGFAAGEPLWPAPERFVLGTIGNYGYAGSGDLLVPIKAPSDLQPGTQTHLGADATWLVCSEICVPGEAHLALDLPVAAAAPAPDPESTALFAAVRGRLPQPAPFAASFTAADNALRLRIPATALTGISRPAAAFFPAAGNLVDAAADPRQASDPDGLVLSLPRLKGAASTAPETLPEKLDGTLVLHGAGGVERVYAIAAPQGVAAATADGATVPWWQALLLALIGGVVLNLMPCVFPI
ncbi:MAG: protein-disulfide reductase DsbD domain-containing protein, partial [Thiohalocapsa sp.]